MNTISNHDDIIDSRDVIARTDELQSEYDDLKAERYDLQTATRDLADWENDYADELKSLTDLQEQAEGYVPDWRYGATLIRESYFTEYIMEMLADIGDLPRHLPHYLVIDEEATANNIKDDYTEVEFDGVTYLVR